MSLRLGAHFLRSSAWSRQRKQAGCGNQAPRFSIVLLRSYVEQDDSHLPHTTVHEALLFSANLRLPTTVDAATRAQFVDEVGATARWALLGSCCCLPCWPSGYMPSFHRKVSRAGRHWWPRPVPGPPGRRHSHRAGPGRRPAHRLFLLLMSCRRHCVLPEKPIALLVDASPLNMP